MKLADVVDRKDLNVLYESRGLANTSDKVSFLREEMGVLAIQGADCDPESDLYALEQLAVLKLWDRRVIDNAA